MTKETINQTIIKHCNWHLGTFANQCVIPRVPWEDTVFVGLPTEDLNAIRLALIMLPDPAFDNYIDNLHILLFGDNAQVDGSYTELRAVLSATALQCATALVMTINPDLT